MEPNQIDEHMLGELRYSIGAEVGIAYSSNIDEGLIFGRLIEISRSTVNTTYSNEWNIKLKVSEHNIIALRLSEIKEIFSIAYYIPKDWKNNRYVFPTMG